MKILEKFSIFSLYKKLNTFFYINRNTGNVMISSSRQSDLYTFPILQGGATTLRSIVQARSERKPVVVHTSTHQYTL